jgi:O-antigen/teichoic acid export membrane protein
MINRQRFRHLFKEGAWIVIGQGMMMMGSLVGVRLLTTLLNPAEYGELALGMTIATFVNQTILGPLAQGVMRFYAPAIETDDLDGYLAAVKRLLAIAALVIFGLISIGSATLLLTGQAKWIAITVSSLIFAGVSGYNYILGGMQNAARQRAIVAVHQGTEAWLKILGAALLIIWLGASSTIAMIGYFGGSVIISVSQSYYFRKVIPNQPHRLDRPNDWQTKMWQYSWPISVFGIFTWFQMVSDRWVLGLFRSKEEVGMYAALFQLGYNPIAMATGMAVQFLEPIFFQKSGDGNDAERNAQVSRLGLRLTGLALGFTGIAFCIAGLFHRQIFEIFVDRQYREVSYLFPWMVLAGGIFAASQTIALNLMSQNKTYKMMPFKIGTALFGMVLNLVGGYYDGIVGIAIANVIFSISCLCSMIALSKY